MKVDERYRDAAPKPVSVWKGACGRCGAITTHGRVCSACRQAEKLTPQGEWAARGRCGELDLSPEEIQRMFFPSPGNSKKANDAKAICASCPVIKECLEYALSIPDIHGVWGGTAENDRRKIRRMRNRMRAG